MQLIPAIDLMDGKVVQAHNGMREKYRPLKTTLFPEAHPSRVVERILSIFDFNILYCADLNAIGDNSNNLNAIHKINNRFPELEIWLDSGIKKYSELTAPDKSITTVIGTETLTENIISTPNTDYILSLDFKGNTLIGHNVLTQISNWPSRTIVLALDRVGSHLGPDLAQLSKIRTCYRGRLYAGGGIRGADDLNELAKIGIEGVLIANTIYNGLIDQSLISKYAGTG